MKAMMFQWVDLADEVAIQALIDDPAWIAQQKFDGVHCVVVIEDGEVSFLGTVGTPLAHAASKLVLPAIEEELRNGGLGLVKDVKCCILDAELIPSTGRLHIFDMPFLQWKGQEPQVVPGDSLQVRLETLAHMGPWYKLTVVETAHVRSVKAGLLADVRASGAEGVVFKRLDAPYEPGDRVAHQLKAKIYKTADVIVLARNRGGACNAVLGAYDEVGMMVEIGQCSMLGKEHDLAVEVGDVVEVKYLYATPPAMRMYGPPDFLRVRTDKLDADCLVSQLVAVSREAVSI